MFNKEDHKQAARSVFMSSIEWLANIGAVVATFLLLPFTYEWSMHFIDPFTRRHYGDELLGAVSVIWLGVVVLFLFFIARMSIGTALVMGGLAVAVRFL